MFKSGTFTVFLSLLLLSVSLPSFAQSGTKPPFRISYAGSVEGRVYAQFVQTIYEELGFNVLKCELKEK